MFSSVASVLERPSRHRCAPSFSYTTRPVVVPQPFSRANPRRDRGPSRSRCLEETRRGSFCWHRGAGWLAACACAGGADLDSASVRGRSAFQPDFRRLPLVVRRSTPRRGPFGTGQSAAALRQPRNSALGPWPYRDGTRPRQSSIPATAFWAPTNASCVGFPIASYVVGGILMLAVARYASVVISVGR